MLNTENCGSEKSNGTVMGVLLYVCKIYMESVGNQDVPAFDPDNMLIHALVRLMGHQNLKKGKGIN